MVKKVVYILSKVDKAVAFEWIVEEFQKSDIQLSFILLADNYDTEISKFLKKRDVPFYHYKLGSKSTYPWLFLNVFRKIREINPNIVHTHLLEASLIGLLAAKFAGVTTRIYTRHHSTSQHEYFPHAVKYDKLNNNLATKIIAISKNVKDVLMDMESVPENKIVLIEHGFKLEYFKEVDQIRVEKLRAKHALPKDKLIIATISRYIKLKGVEFVIEAFSNLYKENTGIHLLLANAGGSYEKQISEKLQLLPQESYTEIRFEPDLFALYQLIDIYCHVPINDKVEAFGQTYIEALAAGIPSIFTISGIANDFVIHEKNALVVPPKNSYEIEASLRRLFRDDCLKNKLIEQGEKSVEKFDLHFMIDRLKHLYLSAR